MSKLAVLSTKALVGAAVIGQLVAFSSQANATAFAYSAMSVENFSMNNEFGGFSTFQFTSQGLSTTLNGNNVSSGQLTCGPASCNLDQAQIVQGGAPFAADNLYFGANRPTLLSTISNYAVADSHMTETVILSGTGGVFGTQSGSQVFGGKTGAASTGTLNSMTWNFNVSAGELAAAQAGGGVLDLTWTSDVLHNTYAEVTNAGEPARATLTYTIALIKQGGGGSAPIEIFDINRSIQFGPDSAGVADEEFLDEAGSFVITEAGNYIFNITFDSSAQSTSINLPEPGTLGLIGLGLIGLGAAYRRKRAA